MCLDSLGGLRERGLKFVVGERLGRWGRIGGFFGFFVWI